MKRANKYFSIILILLIIFSCNKDNNDQQIEEYNPVLEYDLNKTIVSTNTTNVAAGFETVFSESLLDSTERATFSQVFVNGARFYDDGSGYFYIETLDNAWVIAHINATIIGTSRINAQDDYGKYFIQEMVETVKYSGHGFVEYFRINPSNQAYERKLGYVTNIPSAQWFIGTGFYGERGTLKFTEVEAKEMILKETTQTIANGISALLVELYPNEDDAISLCREFIDHMRFFDDGSGYFFINDFEGVNIAHGANEARQGNNDFNIQDANGIYIIQDMINLVQENNSAYYEYMWENPSGGELSKKTTYVTKIPGTPFFIGSGFYMSK